MKKAKFWFILWIVAISLGSVVSAVYELSNTLKNGFIQQTPLYTDFQKFLLLIYLPFCLIPMLGVSYRYAVLEKNKKIKIASICFLIHHIICVMAAFGQIL